MNKQQLEEFKTDLVKCHPTVEQLSHELALMFQYVSAFLIKHPELGGEWNRTNEEVRKVVEE